MQFLYILLIICPLISYTEARIDIRTRIKRKLQSVEFYNASAISFLVEYGLSYHLFDQFYRNNKNSSGRIVQMIIQDGPIIRQKEKITDRYQVLDYSKFKTWDDTTAKVRSEYAALTFDYVPRPSNEEIALYNNRYRYGPQIDDRFMWIGFDRDPWTESSPKELARVYFVGVHTELSASFTYSCKFTSPSIAHSDVIIERGIHDVLDQPTANSVISCEVPWSVVLALTSNMTTITLDLIRSPLDAPLGIKKTVQQRLLWDITITRQHPLDRRNYQHSVQTMVEVLDDLMVAEWVVYNILLGFEHFYIYYNTKSTNLAVEHSLLRPFLDANLITLIYFPYLHTHYMHVQHAALNAFLRGFGRRTQWVAYWDVDEFFLPGSAHVPYLQQPPQPYVEPVVPMITRKLGSWNEPAIMFDTLEMDCLVNSTNFYAGGDNLNLVPGAVAGPVTAREAVTTHCLRTGFLFREMQVGHGKMLVCPSRVSYIASPHRFNHYYTRWTSENDGLIRHFNRFRNTHGLIQAGQFSADDISSDSSLRNFTIASLRELLGVSFRAY